MPCPHNEITIVQRSQRQSAVAAAAYQSGEKLFVWGEEFHACVIEQAEFEAAWESHTYDGALK